MDCRQYQDALNAAALGAESGADVPAFRLHLEICEGCRREFACRREFLGALDLQMRTQFEAAPSVTFNARLRRRIAEAESSRPAVHRWLPVFASAAAIAVLLVIVYARHKPATPRDESALVTPSTRPDAAQQQDVAAANPSEAEQPSSPSKPNAPQQPLLRPVMAAHPSPVPVKVRIDRNEFYATVRFAQAIADGRIDAGPLLSAAQAEDTLGPAKQLKMPVLEISPLSAPSEEDRGEEPTRNDAANH